MTKFSSSIDDHKFVELWMETAKANGTSKDFRNAFVEAVKAADGEDKATQAQGQKDDYFYNRVGRIRKALKEHKVELPELKGKSGRAKKDWGAIAKLVGSTS